MGPGEANPTRSNPTLVVVLGVAAEVVLGLVGGVKGEWEGRVSGFPSKWHSSVVLSFLYDIRVNAGCCLFFRPPHSPPTRYFPFIRVVIMPIFTRFHFLFYSFYYFHTTTKRRAHTHAPQRTQITLTHAFPHIHSHSLPLPLSLSLFLSLFLHSFCPLTPPT